MQRGAIACPRVTIIQAVIVLATLKSLQEDVLQP
jgi:hypothetical protein